MNRDLQKELDSRLQQISTLEPGSEERTQLFDEYKTMYQQVLSEKNQEIDVRKQDFEEYKTELQDKSDKKHRIIDICKTIAGVFTTVGGWVFYLAMADRFMKFDATGEVPDPMLKDLFRLPKKS